MNNLAGLYPVSRTTISSFFSACPHLETLQFLVFINFEEGSNDLQDAEDVLHLCLPKLSWFVIGLPDCEAQRWFWSVFDFDNNCAGQVEIQYGDESDEVIDGLSMLLLTSSTGARLSLATELTFTTIIDRGDISHFRLATRSEAGAPLCVSFGSRSPKQVIHTLLSRIGAVHKFDHLVTLYWDMREGETFYATAPELAGMFDRLPTLQTFRIYLRSGWDDQNVIRALEYLSFDIVPASCFNPGGFRLVLPSLRNLGVYNCGRDDFTCLKHVVRIRHEHGFSINSLSISLDYKELTHEIDSIWTCVDELDVVDTPPETTITPAEMDRDRYVVWGNIVQYH
jgi:hypothetical protein